MLRECDQFWGRRTVIGSEPAVEEHFGAIYIPFTPYVFFDGDPQWGIYDRNRDLIEGAALFRGPEKKLVGQTWQRGEIEALEAPEPTYIYGGPVVPHYGHFITATLARLWYLRGRRDDPTKILFHSGHGKRETFEALPYVAAAFQALGIIDRVVIFDRPTRVPHLIVPRPAFEEQSFAHFAFADLCHTIGERLIDMSAGFSDRPVYLTKTRLRSGVGRIRNEAEIEAVMERAGIEVISPEMLSLAEQMTLFATRPAILGTSTSAFHTHIFARPFGRIFVLNPNRLINSNFSLLDSINLLAPNYLYPEEGAGPVWNEDGFLTQFEIPNPRAVAEELLAMCESRREASTGSPL